MFVIPIAISILRMFLKAIEKMLVNLAIRRRETF